MNDVGIIKNSSSIPMKDCCSICLESYDLPLTLANCTHKFCYLCAKELKISNPHGNITCPLCRSNIQDNFDHIKFDDKDQIIKCFLNKQCWLYQARDMQGWWFYGKKTNRDIEKLFQHDNTQKIKILVGSRNYNIDFQTMMQEYNTKLRKVKRIDDLQEKDIEDYNIKGVAGVFFEIKDN
jgi:WWE domain/Zinc finger, C3HC4 type (RING finger)